MEIKDLKIGDEVYCNVKWSKDYNIGKIIGETPKYWKIKFGKQSADLFSKDSLYMRGGDTWNFISAYPLSSEKKTEILAYKEISLIEREINNSLKVGISLRDVENGKRILELIVKMKDLIKQDAILGADE